MVARLVRCVDPTHWFPRMGALRCATGDSLRTTAVVVVVAAIQGTPGMAVLSVRKRCYEVLDIYCPVS